MIILAIETSCDETSISLLKAERGNFKILSNIVSSQIKVHRKWGGVVPTLAKREHQKNLVPVLKRALNEAGLLKRIKGSEPRNKNLKFAKIKEILAREEILYKKTEAFLKTYQKPRINFISIASGPGLEPALWVGVNFSRTLSYFWNLPIVAVNHVEAHIFANFFDKRLQNKRNKNFPILCLSVAGGHTQLILMRNYGKYKLIGETRDDTAGECFDKVARMLELGYPGGPIISSLAQKGNLSAFNFPRPMIYAKNYDFSFSGLKTAVLYFLRKKSKGTIKKKKKDICASFQQAVIDVLIFKTIRAAKEFKVKNIMISGGVAANKELRKQLAEKIKRELPDVNYIIPDIEFCTDNAVMVAMTAYFKPKKNRTKNWQEIVADANIKIQ